MVRLSHHAGPSVAMLSTYTQTHNHTNAHTLGALSPLDSSEFAGEGGTFAWASSPVPQKLQNV